MGGGGVSHLNYVEAFIELLQGDMHVVGPAHGLHTPLGLLRVGQDRPALALDVEDVVPAKDGGRGGGLLASRLRKEDFTT